MTTASPAARVDAAPHVTAILREAGLIDDRWFTEEARDRGSGLHLAARYLDEGDLDWESVDPRILPRLRSYQKFLDEVRPEILAVEEAVFNEAFNYQGRLDRRARINGAEGIYDIKAPGEAAWQAIQVSLYARTFPRPLRRWTLHLSDERYKLVEHRGWRDWEVAKAALVLAAWRRENS